MSDDEKHQRASGVFAERVTAVREAHRLNQQELVELLAERFDVKMDRATLTRIENGKRKVSLDEALMFAVALDVAPVHLLAPPDDDARVEVVRGVTASATEVRAWIRGEAPLQGVDEQTFRAEVPASEWRRAQQEADVADTGRRVARQLAQQEADAKAEVRRGLARQVRVAETLLEMLEEQRRALPSIELTAMIGSQRATHEHERERLEKKIDRAMADVAEARADWQMGTA